MENPTIKAFGLTTRFWTLSDKWGYGCAECCNGDHDEDEDCDHTYYRKNCPHCKGKGWIKIEDIQTTD